MQRKRIFATLLTAALCAQASAFTLTSPELKPGELMPSRYEFNSFGCTGENLSPALNWRSPPSGTQAFAVTMYDPDAPTGSGWWHWSVINIPANVNQLATDAGRADASLLPAGAQTIRNDYGQTAWGGVCPPPGDKAHRYVFTVFALKDKLTVPADASAALAGYMIRANSLGKATMTVRYGRKKH